jgi:hypothetical protein
MRINDVYFSSAIPKGKVCGLLLSLREPPETAEEARDPIQSDGRRSFFDLLVPPNKLHA